VASGAPLIKVGNEERRVERGGVAVVHSGQSHQLVNDTPHDVEIFVIQVRLPETHPALSSRPSQ
jgi:mannose-6-phosphate isomerase-like protein (cupin superfamily)